MLLALQGLENTKVFGFALGDVIAFCLATPVQACVNQSAVPPPPLLPLISLCICRCRSALPLSLLCVLLKDP